MLLDFMMLLIVIFQGISILKTFITLLAAQITRNRSWCFATFPDVSHTIVALFHVLLVFISPDKILFTPRTLTGKPDNWAVTFHVSLQISWSNKGRTAILDHAGIRSNSFMTSHVGLEVTPLIDYFVTFVAFVTITCQLFNIIPLVGTYRTGTHVYCMFGANRTSPFNCCYR